MWRRYTHFDWLHKRLCEKFSMIIIPPLPDRGGRTAAGGGSSDLSHHLFVHWAIKWYMPDLWCVYVGVLVHCPSIAFYLLAFVLGLSDQHPNNILRWIRFEFSARVGKFTHLTSKNTSKQYSVFQENMVYMDQVVKCSPTKDTLHGSKAKNFLGLYLSDM